MAITLTGVALVSLAVAGALTVAVIGLAALFGTHEASAAEWTLHGAATPSAASAPGHESTEETSGSTTAR